eukprot:m.33901 g.33901  ORF g.33901 m.33901 type:complete len:366 (-) comp9693_c0_seq2:318-1415(-)
MAVEHYYPAESGCRHIDVYEKLNRIDEGTFGVVFRVKDKGTGEVFAVKKLKLHKERDGFPITALREINTLLKVNHENIVNVRELVVGDTMDDVFIVMEFVEHDLKALLETMDKPPLRAEVKMLMKQLLCGVAHLHDNWLIHRDLKTSNLLLSHKGILKIADFGLAREFGSPTHNMTQLVVTLWYRAPELLLGTKEYTTAVDVWSVGCIFAEFLTQQPLFPAKGEIDMIHKVFKMLGTPNDDIWPGYSELPTVQKVKFRQHPAGELQRQFGAVIGRTGMDLLTNLLTYDPAQRITAEEAFDHPWFTEHPPPIPPELFPHFPARAEGHVRRQASPTLGDPGVELTDEQRELQFLMQNKQTAGFSLRF